MGSSSKSTSTNTSQELSNSLNTTVTGTVGQSGLGLFSGGNISGAAYVNSFDSPTTLTFNDTTSKVSNVGSGSASGVTSPVSDPSVSAGSATPSILANLTGYLPYILLAGGLLVAYLILRKR
jgi:hypothetical protein